MSGSLLIVHVHVRVKPGRRGGLPRGVARQRRGEPARARRRALRPPRRPRRPAPLRARRDLPRRRRRRRAQGDRPLRGVARRGGGPDGRAAPQREVRERLARRRGLVSGRAVRVRDRGAHRLRPRRRSPSSGDVAAALGRRALARHRALAGARRPPPASGSRRPGVATVGVRGRRRADRGRRAARAPSSAAPRAPTSWWPAAAAARSTRGKAIAALLGNGGDPLDYLEVVGRGQPLDAAVRCPSSPIPTTAGTGSEVTRNAVLASPEHRVKASLRSPLMLPRGRHRRPRPARRPAAARRRRERPRRLRAARRALRLRPREPARRRARAARASRARRARCAARTRATAREPVRVGPRAREPLRRARPRQRRPRRGARLRGAGRRALRRAARRRLRGPAAGRPAREPRARSPRRAAGRAPRSPATARSPRSSPAAPAAEAEDGVAWVEDLVRALGVPGLSHWGASRVATCRRSSRRPRAASSMKGNPVELDEAELARDRARARSRAGRAGTRARPREARRSRPTCRPRRQAAPHRRVPPHAAAPEAHAGARLGALLGARAAPSPARPATSASEP